MPLTKKGKEFLREVEPLIDSLYLNQPRKAKAFKNGARKRITKSGKYPFANPFNWAAFTTTGL